MLPRTKRSLREGPQDLYFVVFKRVFLLPEAKLCVLAAFPNPCSAFAICPPLCELYMRPRGFEFPSSASHLRTYGFAVVCDVMVIEAGCRMLARCLRMLLVLISCVLLLLVCQKQYETIIPDLNGLW